MLYRPPLVWFLHIIYWFLANWGPMWRNGRGVAWHRSKYFFESFPLIWCFTDPPLYDSSIWSSDSWQVGLQCDETGGGGLALIQIFLFDAFPVMPVEGQWDGARLWNNGILTTIQSSLWAFEGVKELRHVTIWPIWF